MSVLLIDFMKHICLSLDRENIPYCLAGGLAVSIWGPARGTVDVDIVAHISNEERERIVHLFEKDFNLMQSHKDDMVMGMVKIWRHIFHYKNEPDILQLDLIIVPDAYSEKIMNRKIEIEEYGMKISVISKEDLIVLKLASFRNQDKADIEKILEHDSTLDWFYLENTVKQYGDHWDFIKARGRPHTLNA